MGAFDFTVYPWADTSNPLIAFFKSAASAYGGVYFGLQDEIGATTIQAYPNQGNNASNDGVTLGEAGPANTLSGLFDGTNDVIDIYTAMAALFDATKGTLAALFRIPTSGIWTDSAFRVGVAIAVDANNRVNIMKTTVNNTFRLRYEANTTDNVLDTTVLAGSTDWFLAGLTWSVANDRVRPYVNGAQIGADLTGLGTWAGALDNTTCVIGGSDTTYSTPFAGYIAHVIYVPQELEVSWWSKAASLAGVS